MDVNVLPSMYKGSFLSFPFTNLRLLQLAEYLISINLCLYFFTLYSSLILNNVIVVVLLTT